MVLFLTSKPIPLLSRLIGPSAFFRELGPKLARSFSNFKTETDRYFFHFRLVPQQYSYNTVNHVCASNEAENQSPKPGASVDERADAGVNDRCRGHICHQKPMHRSVIPSHGSPLNRSWESGDEQALKTLSRGEGGRSLQVSGGTPTPPNPQPPQAGWFFLRVFFCQKGFALFLSIP